MWQFPLQDPYGKNYAINNANGLLEWINQRRFICPNNLAAGATELQKTEKKAARLGWTVFSNVASCHWVLKRRKEGGSKKKKMEKK